MLQLVVARHRENLNWLRNIRADVSVAVYNKGPDPQLGSIPLENQGREAHTYLHHLCENYAGLSEVMVFCQGHPFDHAFDFHRILHDAAACPGCAPGFRWIGHTVDTESKDGQLFRNWSKNSTGESLDLAGFHRELWGEEGPAEYPFYLGGQFLVRRELVLKKPRSFYERALQISLSFPAAAHCYERCWDRVFGVPGAASHVLAGRKTAHLKRVKKPLTFP